MHHTLTTLQYNSIVFEYRNNRKKIMRDFIEASAPSPLRLSNQMRERFLGRDPLATIHQSRPGRRRRDGEFMSAPWSTMEIVAEFKSKESLLQFLKETSDVFVPAFYPNRLSTQDRQCNIVAFKDKMITFDVGLNSIPWKRCISRLVDLQSSAISAKYGSSTMMDQPLSKFVQRSVT